MLKKAYKGKDYQSRFRNLPLKEEQLQSQVDAELNFSGRLEGRTQQTGEPPRIAGGTSATGVMPIQIQVPTGGQVYRFDKTIVKSEDPLTIKIFYVQYWIIKTIKWLIILIIILFLYIKRKNLQKILQKAKEGFNALKKHEPLILKYAESRITTVVLFFLFLISLSFSSLLALIFCFLFCVSLIYQFVLFRGKKSHQELNLDEIDDHEEIDGVS